MRKFVILLWAFLLVPTAFALPQGKVVCLLKKTPQAAAELINPSVVEQAVRNAITHSAAKVIPLSIANLPSQPVVQFQFNTPFKAQIPQPIQILPRGRVFDFVFFDGTCKKLFIPDELLGSEKALYRGMRVVNMSDVKNLLINGLQVEKVRLYSKEIFTSSDVSRAMLYAVPNFVVDANLPVIIKMPFSSKLQKQVVWQDLDVTVFKKDISPELISGVWVLLTINGKPDWCKAVLKDGELVLIPSHGKFYDRAEIDKR